MDKQDLELKELALHFFKMGGVSAEEAYEHALSFLSTKKDKYGKDIIELTIKYNTKNIANCLCFTFVFEGEEENVRMLGVSDIKNKEISNVIDYIQDKILGDYYDEDTVVDWNIEQDLNIAVSDNDAYNVATY